MKKIIYLTTIIVLLVLYIFFQKGCQNNYINDYGTYLKIDFPDDLELIHLEQKSDFQDYSNLSIYKLKWLQKDSILRQVNKNLCDVNDTIANCWIKNNKGYSYKDVNSTNKSQYYLKVDLVENENYDLLIIYELKW